MRFVVDVNLPPRLCGMLRGHNHEAVHLQDLGMLQADDEQVWDLAKRGNWIVTSKDSDFCDWALLRGPPPQVLHIGTGNLSNEHLIQLLVSAWAEIDGALNQGAKLVSLQVSSASKASILVF